MWLGKWQFLKRSDGSVKASLPFHEGLMQTVTGVRCAAANLLHGGFRYVLTARFNQDIVENWFSAVRAKGFNNDSRTTTDYEYAVKNIAVNWLLDQPEKSRNCTEDGDSFVTVLGI